MSFYIRKYSGEKQRFDLHKFRRSLFKAGASNDLANQIVSLIEHNPPKTTKQLHDITSQFLQKYAPVTADRYNLKRALMAFGPVGYPFEKFIAQLFTRLGYTTTHNVTVDGFCVTHEVDVVAKKSPEHLMIECKFHNRPGLKSDVKVALYVQARFEDIRSNDQQEKPTQACLVTNTKFSTEAIKYSECKNIRLIGWSYPQHHTLAELIDKTRLFPITTLTSLSRYQKNVLLKNGIVLCQEVHQQPHTLQKLGFKPQDIEKIMQDANAVCAI